MKKVLMAAGLIMALTGYAVAQTSPAPAQKKAKKEQTAPAKDAKQPMAKDTSGHHAKKHHAKKQAK